MPFGIEIQFSGLRRFLNFDWNSIARELENELIQRVCGILDVNSFEIRIQTDVAHQDGEMPNPLLSTVEVLKASYFEAAMMAHSCVANAQISIGADHQMVVRAQVPIHRGDTIYINYADPFQTTLQRRNFLYRGKCYWLTFSWRFNNNKSS